MRQSFRAAVIVAVFSGVSQAEISDPGSLTIGGQAVVSGTMTVQGSAFSVGGSTFQVAGGSVTLGGRLNAAATGIRFGDGTVQVSSPPASVAPNSIVARSAVFNTIGLRSNEWNTVSIASSTGVGGSTFTALSSTYSYRGICQGTKRTAGDLIMRTTGDSGAFYSQHIIGQAGTNNISGNSAVADTKVNLTNVGGGVTPADGGYFKIHFDELSTVWGSTTAWSVRGWSEARYTGGNNTEYGWFNTYYFGTVAFGSISILTTAGTMDIWCRWEQFYTTLNH